MQSYCFRMRKTIFGGEKIYIRTNMVKNGSEAWLNIGVH